MVGFFTLTLAETDAEMLKNRLKDKRFLSIPNEFKIDLSHRSIGIRASE